LESDAEEPDPQADSSSAVAVIAAPTRARLDEDIVVLRV
jgi:hypothetical protein